MYSCQRRCSNRLHNRHFELYTNHSHFNFLYKFHELQEMSEEALKCNCINLCLKLNSDLNKNDLYEELNLFRKGFRIML